MAVTKEVLNLFEPQNILKERGKAGTRGRSPEANRSGKKAKKISANQRECTPTPCKNFDFGKWHARGICIYYPTPLSVLKKFVPLYMPWEMEIHNRINIGFCLGWSYYAKDADHDWVELNIYLGLIGITIKY